VTSITAFSDASVTAQDRFYKKWQPIIISGEEPSKFMNSHATWMLP